MKPRIKISRLCYVDISKHWRKIKPVITSPQAEHIWRQNMLDYGAQRGWKKKNYSAYKSPSEFDSCDWRCEPRVGRAPSYWRWVCWNCCHFLVDLNLFLAIKTFPQFEWRIITYANRKNDSDSHSTVWNGDAEHPLLFDMNFLALGVPAKQAWQTAIKGMVMPPWWPLNPERYDMRILKLPDPPSPLVPPKATISSNR